MIAATPTHTQVEFCAALTALSMLQRTSIVAAPPRAAVPGTHALQLPLVAQLQLKPCMQFAPYINSLPDLETMDLPTLWPKDEVATLRCAHVIAAIAEQRTLWSGWCQDLRGCPTFDASKEEVQWALSCVTSRTFKGPYIGSSARVCCLVVLSCVWPR
jgi:hypothetical protein